MFNHVLRCLPKSSVGTKPKMIEFGGDGPTRTCLERAEPRVRRVSPDFGMSLPLSSLALAGLPTDSVFASRIFRGRRKLMRKIREVWSSLSRSRGSTGPRHVLLPPTRPKNRELPLTAGSRGAGSGRSLCVVPTLKMSALSKKPPRRDQEHGDKEKYDQDTKSVTSPTPLTDPTDEVPIPRRRRCGCGCRCLVGILCSVRTIAILIFMVCLLINTGALVGTAQGISQSIVTHLKTQNQRLRNEFAASAVSEYFGRAAVIVRSIAQYVRQRISISDLDMYNDIDIDLDPLTQEDFIRDDFGPFLLQLHASVLSIPHPEHSQLYAGFVSTQGSSVFVINHSNKNRGLGIAYHNSSIAPLYWWGSTGGSGTRFGSNSWGLLGPEKRVPIAAQYTPFRDYYYETLNDGTHQPEEIQWRQAHTAVGNFSYVATLRIDAPNTNTSVPLGVVAAWMTAQGSVNFLKKQFPLDEGVAFLMGPNGTLHGSNTDYYDIFTATEDGLQVPFRGDKSPNAYIAACASFVLEARNNANDVVSPDHILSVEGYGRLVVTQHRFTAAGIELIFVSGLYYGPLYGLLELCLGLSIGTSFLVLVASALAFVVFISILVRPLRHLMKAMRKVEDMELDNVVFGRSVLTEVASLQAAFKFTVSKLAEYRSFLPVDLLRKQRSDSDDDDADVDSDAVSSCSKDSLPSVSSEASGHSVQSSMRACVQRFGVSLEEDTPVLAMVRITGMRNYDPFRTDFLLSFIRSLFESIVALSDEFKATVVEYRMNAFLLTFPTSQAACLFSLKLCQRVLPRPLSNYGSYGCLVILHKGLILRGNVGSSTMRKSAACGDSVRFVRQVAEGGVITAGPNDLVVLCTSRVHQELEPAFLRFPYDVVPAIGRGMILFRLVGFSGEKISTLQIYDAFSSAASLIAQNRFEDARLEILSFTKHVDSLELSDMDWVRLHLKLAIKSARSFMMFAEHLAEQEADFVTILRSPAFVSLRINTDEWVKNKPKKKLVVEVAEELEGEDGTAAETVELLVGGGGMGFTSV